MTKKLTAKRKSSGKRGRFDRFVVWGIVITLVVIALALWGPLRKARVAAGKKPPVQAAGNPETTQKRPEKQIENQAIKPGEQSVLVAIVIDDLGQSIKQAHAALALPRNVTFAVMPGLPQSRQTAQLAKQNGRELLLHLPMEYRGKNGNPAPGMLRSDMTPMEFLNTLSEDVGSVPGATGVNNHEGSALTENKEAMKFLMAELKARNLPFLDSLTSPGSVAYVTAKEFGLKAAKRDVFLDNEGNNPAYIRKQLDELLSLARKHGKAIGIGHPHAATLSELRKWLAQADHLGIELVPVSRLMQ